MIWKAVRKAVGVVLIGIPVAAWVALGVASFGWPIAMLALVAVAVVCGMVVLGAWLLVG